jgi:hypothetical protein
MPKAVASRLALACVLLASPLAACFGESSGTTSPGGSEDAGDATPNDVVGAEGGGGSSGGSSPAGEGGTDAPGESASTMDACAQPSGWPAVTPTTADAAAPPAQSGGALVSGTYFLTAMSYYESGCAADETLRVAILVSADPGGASGTMTEVSEATAGNSSAGGCISGTFQATGSTLVRTSHTTLTESFTATPTGFTLVDGEEADAGDCEPTLMTFTKQ